MRSNSFRTARENKYAYHKLLVYHETIFSIAQELASKEALIFLRDRHHFKDYPMIEEAMNLAIEKKGMLCGTVPTASVLKDATISLSMGRQEDVPPCEVVSSSVTESGLSFNEQLSDDDFNDQECSNGPENQQMGFMAKQQENFGEYNDLSDSIIHYCTRFPCDQGVGLSPFIPPNPSSLECNDLSYSIARL